MNTLNVKLSHSISQLYETLCQVGKSTFAELQRATNFKDTELCLALLLAHARQQSISGTYQQYHLLHY